MFSKRSRIFLLPSSIFTLHYLRTQNYSVVFSTLFIFWGTFVNIKNFKEHLSKTQLFPFFSLLLWELSYILDGQFLYEKNFFELKILSETVVRNFEKYVRKFFRRRSFAEVFSPNLYPPKHLGINVTDRANGFSVFQ